MAKLFVENLINLDFTYFCPTHGLVGETLLVDFELEGPENEQGMILDFGFIKRQVSDTIESSFDHRLVLPMQALVFEPNDRNSSKVKSIHLEKDPVEPRNYLMTLNSQAYTCTISMPEAGFYQLHASAVTPQALSQHLTDKLTAQSWWQHNWHCHLNLYQPQEQHTFQYSHGLSQHLGACQRIAHGHRSKMAIFINDQFNEALTKAWCEQWHCTYIGSELDLAQQTEQSYHFEYVSSEGRYRLTIPKDRVYLLKGQTTIEHIAQHLADAVSENLPANLASSTGALTIKTRVYEGFQKGAMGFALAQKTHK